MNADNEKNRQRKNTDKGCDKDERKNQRMQTMNNAPSTCAWNFLETFRVLNLGGYYSIV